MSQVSYQSILYQDKLKPSVESKITYINDVLGNLFGVVQNFELENRQLKALIELLVHFKHMLLVLKQNFDCDQSDDLVHKLGTDFNVDLERCLEKYRNLIKKSKCFDFVQCKENVYKTNITYCKYESKIDNSDNGVTLLDDLLESFQTKQINNSYGNINVLDSGQSHVNEMTDCSDVDGDNSMHLENSTSVIDKQKSSTVDNSINSRLRSSRISLFENKNVPAGISRPLKKSDNKMAATVTFNTLESDENQDLIEVGFLFYRSPNVSLLFKEDGSSYACLIPNCDFSCDRRLDMTSHIYKHLDIQPFTCSVCSYVSEQNKLLLRHSQRNHNIDRDIVDLMKFFRRDENGDFVCNFRSCQFKTEHMVVLIGHLNWHMSSKPFKCSHCPLRFHDPKDCLFHLGKSHKRKRTGVLLASKTKCPYNCDTSIDLTNFRAMLKHLKEIHDFKIPPLNKGSKQAKLVVTPSISIKSKDVKNLKKNIKKSSANIAKVSKIARINKPIGKLTDSTDLEGFQTCYSCSYDNCRFESKSLTQVKAHEFRRHMKKVYKCSQEECDLIFITREEFSEHLNDVHGISEYKCGVDGCSRGFSNAIKLKSHMNDDHTNESKTCTICHKQFNTRRYMMRHIRMCHFSGEFTCIHEGCDFRGRYRNELNKHMINKHAETKQCPFEGCGLMLSRQIYKTHLNRHLKIKNHKCSWPECDKSFVDRKSLKDHIRIHLNFKRFKCTWPDCGYGSEQRSNVIKHIRIRHLMLPYTKKQEREMNIEFDLLPQKPQDFIEVNKEDIQI